MPKKLPTEEFDWADLQRAWQEPPKDELPDLEQLLKRRSRGIWALTGFDALLSLVTLGVVTWWLIRNPSPAIIAFSILVFLAHWGTVLWIRRGTWRLDTAAPAAMLQLSVRRCRASIKLAQYNQWSLVLGFIAGLIVIGIVFKARSPHSGLLDLGFEIPLWIRALLLLAAAAWLVACEVYKRRKIQELAKLEQLQDEL